MHKLKKHLALYDGSYETMRKLRTYLSFALNTETKGIQNISILTREYGDIIHRIMLILDEHGQSIVGRDNGVWIYTKDGNVFEPVTAKDVPLVSLPNLVHFRLEFPELEAYL
jgi:hypothetical protein